MCNDHSRCRCTRSVDLDDGSSRWMVSSGEGFRYKGENLQIGMKVYFLECGVNGMYVGVYGDVHCAMCNSLQTELNL